MQKMMLRIEFRYAFYGKTEHSFESGIMKIKVIQRDTEVQMKEIKLKAMEKSILDWMSQEKGKMATMKSA